MLIVIVICFRFDWSGKESLLYNEKVSLSAQPITSGIAHAIFMWWDLNMDMDNQVIASYISFTHIALFYVFLYTFSHFTRIKRSTAFLQVLLSCAPVWEHPDVSDYIKEDTLCFNEMADLIPWRDHWMQAVYYLPEEVPIMRGDVVNLVGYHDEYSFWFKLLNGSV